MAQLLFSLAFLALAIAAVRVLAHELTRPLQQPWLQSGFGGVVAQPAARPVDLTDRRLRRDIVATARQSSAASWSAAA